MDWIETECKTRRITSEEVMAFFNDVARQQYDGEPVSEIGDHKIITRDWTVDDLLFDIFLTDCNTENWQEIGQWLTNWFRIEATDDELECLLKKPHNTTMGELCDFLATRATVEILSPARIMGQTNWEAGIFRTIHQVLKKAGADVSDLAPSSKLEPYLKDYYSELQNSLSILVPGYLPSVDIRRAAPVEWISKFAGWGGFIGSMSMITGIIFGSVSNSAWPWFIGISGFGVMICSFALAGILSPFKPCLYKLGEFVTFRDLCFALAAHKRAEDAGHPSIIKKTDSTSTAASNEKDILLKPVIVLGSSSLAASLFKSISEALARDGADTSQLGPSTELEPYIRDHRRTFIMHLSKVAPGKAPTIQEEFPYHARTIRNICRKIIWGSGTAYLVIAFIIGFLLRPDLLIPIGITAICITVVLAGIMFCCDLIKPTLVRFGDCITFKDLCRALAPKD